MYYHCVDISTGGILVPEGIIRPVVSASELTWFIRYIYYWNLQFLNNAIFNQTKGSPSLDTGDLSRIWLSCFGSLGLLFPKI